MTCAAQALNTLQDFKPHSVTSFRKDAKFGKHAPRSVRAVRAAGAIVDLIPPACKGQSRRYILRPSSLTAQVVCAIKRFGTPPSTSQVRTWAAMAGMF